MEDWRYEILKTDVKELRKDISDLRGRTGKVENWQWIFPLRLMMVIAWLAVAGIWVVGLAR